MFGLLSRLAGFLIKCLLILLFYATPLLGFWLASSLAAYMGGPHYLAWTAGLFLFLIIPGIWELHAWTHRKSEGKAWLTPLDRLSLRTFVVGLVFVAVLLYLFPQTAFVSLSTRGDWMLDDVKDSRADTARRVLFAAAGGLEWLYRATKNNPYKQHIDAKARQRSDEAARQLKQEVAQREKDTAQQRENKTDTESNSTQKDENNTATQSDSNTSQQKEKDTSKQSKQSEANKQNKIQLEKVVAQANKPEMKWPWRNTAIHPIVSTIPASAETSIESVAQYIKQHESNPLLRIKALHDYVADRIAYDTESFYAGKIPSQDAQLVFENRKSVCAGYANLLSALAASTGDEIVVVTGDARDPKNGDKLTGMGHAWNAAHINDHWYLIDACWDAGYVSREKGFTKSYKTDYLLPPAEVMIQDHFPEDPNWQLLSQPLSQGEFLRQPMLRPSFQEADLKLISPRRPRVEASTEAVVILQNPKNRWLMAGLDKDGKDIGSASTPTNSEKALLDRPLPDKGTYRMNLFVNDEREGSYTFVGSVDFVNR